MRKTILTVALVAFASPVWAQATQQAKDNDPTHKVAGGISVAGWQGRVDPKEEVRGRKIEDAKFASMGTTTCDSCNSPAISTTAGSTCSAELSNSTQF